jgi:hypothetical protein
MYRIKLWKRNIKGRLITPDSAKVIATTTTMVRRGIELQPAAALRYLAGAGGIMHVSFQAARLYAS